MKTTVKKLSDTKVEIKVVLDKKDLAAAREKAITRLATEVKIPGFRKGKVPADMAKKHLNPNDIAQVALDIAVRTSVPEACCPVKHRPYFSNTLSPKQPGNLIKESPGCWVCGGAWPRGRVSRGSEAGPAPAGPGCPESLSPLDPGLSSREGAHAPGWSSVSFQGVHFSGRTREAPLCVFFRAVPKRMWCFGPHSGSRRSCR